jgi:hypothetical protein
MLNVENVASVLATDASYSQICPVSTVQTQHIELKLFSGFLLWQKYMLAGIKWMVVIANVNNKFKNKKGSGIQSFYIECPFLKQTNKQQQNPK